MKVTEIVVSAGRTFNHPYEQYSNLKPAVTLKATLAEGESYLQAVRDLQADAEKLVEDHKQLMLKSLEEIEELTHAEREFADLTQAMKRAQDQMEAIRQKHPKLAGLLDKGEDE